MKLTVSRAALVAALVHVAAIVGKGGAHASSSSALIEAGSGASIRATDAVSVDIRVELEGADVKAPGSIAVPARDLLDRVKAMPEGASVDLALVGDKLTIKSKGDRRFTLRTLPATEMPAWPKRGAGATVVLPTVVVRAAIAAVSHSMSTDSSRPDVHGAQLAFDGTTFRADAADGGKRLAVYDRDVAALSDELSPFSALISHRAVGVVERILGSADRVAITRSGTQLFLEAGTATLVLNIVAAQLPPTRVVLANIKTKASGEVVRAGLLDAVRSVGLSAAGKGKGIDFRLVDGTLTLSATDENGEEALDTLTVASTSPEEAEATFPAEQIAEALAAAPSDVVVLGFETNGPMLLTSENDGGKARFVINSIRRAS